MDKKQEKNEDDEFSESFLQTLEQQTNWDGSPMVKYRGFWYLKRFIRQELSSHKHFKARDSDIILSTLPKSGTTWLKALAYSIVNRDTIYRDIGQNPLLTCNPHTLVPFLFMFEENNPHEFDQPTDPRIFATHTPFEALADSIRQSACKIIYVCRNPLDQFVSIRHFLIDNKIEKDHAGPLGLDESFDMFCEGTHPVGPFWDHMTGYWNAQLENPRKVLFLKYEDMKEDIVFNVKKIADFLGCPFSSEEEERGMVEEISEMCSFQSLKNVDRNGYSFKGIFKNSTFFRKGEVGDWSNCLTPAMAERMKKLVEIKFQGSPGLTFKI
ncbi:hypothetical protein ABFS82_02G128100 [Erythranthe guttata]|uniref:Sulfotransferase n=1 Tax=Erythranthe guttata TaxID=4155 RepID=A0A022QGT3_ERYGU|nr:PREDICTED: cytosolic sulfotransferase 15-like [Erythranthe guttata]XP_012849775.1 PREDICTED: cytosolic sulfotransferase 15-like [Erythranthe guttata]EYU27151.1 hypothetical protein MIMGU_mgv1a010018mg [Erythranthe guttata]|eukprot:XP_012849774.1 PREDICTED: cytosolic sulfotransferase 15-like [Erythranthe guttata]